MEKKFGVKFFSYYGSKTYMTSDIYKLVSPLKNKINCFVDVFGGSGVVLLNLPFAMEVKVYNDIDLYLYKTFKVLQDKFLRQELVEKLELSFTHRLVFDQFRESIRENHPLDDVECAFATIYLCQHSFGGAQQYFRSVLESKTRDYSRASVAAIKSFSHSLRNWIIENLDFRELLLKFDSPSTFFYLDPPYLGGGDQYRFGSWGIGAFREMKRILDKLQGMWMMNESEVDFSELIPIFGEPQMTKSYSNNMLNKSLLVNGERSERLEGFWTSFPIEKTSSLSKFIS